MTRFTRSPRRCYIRPTIETRLRDKTRMEATRAVVAHDVPAGPVQTATEILACPQGAARDLPIDLDYPGLKVVASPILLRSSTQLARQAPLLDEHSQAVLYEFLRIDDSAARLLRADGQYRSTP